MKATRNHKAYWAFLGHRISGLALGVFLPIHFYVLGMAIEDTTRLSEFIQLADMPAFKFGEWGLVIFLSIHMSFGLRLLVMELFSWRSVHDARLSWITWGVLTAAAFGLLFVLGVMG